MTTRQEETHGQRRGGETERKSLVAEIREANLGILPGITEIVFRALRTLKVRRADKLPSFIFSDTYLQNQTTVIGNYKQHLGCPP